MFRFCFSCGTVAYSAAGIRSDERCMRCEGDRLAGTAVRAVPSPLAVLVDADMSVVWLSAGLRRELGVQEDLVAGRPIEMFLRLGAPKDPDTPALSAREAIANRRVLTVEAETDDECAVRWSGAVQLVPTHDGRLILFLWNPDQLPDANGEPHLSVAG